MTTASAAPAPVMWMPSSTLPCSPSVRLSEGYAGGVLPAIAGRAGWVGPVGAVGEAGGANAKGAEVVGAASVATGRARGSGLAVSAIAGASGGGSGKDNGAAAAGDLTTAATTARAGAGDATISVTAGGSRAFGRSVAFSQANAEISMATCSSTARPAPRHGQNSGADRRARPALSTGGSGRIWRAISWLGRIAGQFDFKHIVSKHQHAIMLGLGFRFHMDGDRHTLQFGQQRRFDPVADVMCRRHRHLAGHHQVKLQKIRRAGLPDP